MVNGDAQVAYQWLRAQADALGLPQSASAMQCIEQIALLIEKGLEASVDERAHWYALTFMWVTDDGKHEYRSVYRGVRSQSLTLADIAIAKESESAPEHALLVGCGYLGHMTRGEFTRPPAK